MNNMRDPVFDIVKFIVMIGVVAGHCAAYGLTDGGMFQPYIGNVVVGLSMPTFFAISGFFAAKSIDRANNSQVLARIAGFVWPLISFGIVFAFIAYFRGELSVSEACAYPVRRLIGEGWFLRTLAIIYLIFAIIWNISTRKECVRGVLVCVVYAVLFFMPRQGVFYWSSSVFHMFPYFAFGAIVLRKYNVYKNHMISVICGLIFILVVIFEGDVRTNGMGFYWVASNWQDIVTSLRDLSCLLARTLLGCAGTVFLLWFVGRLLAVIPILEKVAGLGTTTLGVYVIHEWPIIHVARIGGFHMLGPKWQWPMGLAIFFICHFLTTAIRRNAYLKIFFFGDEKWLASVFSRLRI